MRIKLQVETPRQKCTECNKLKTNFNFAEHCIFNDSKLHNWRLIE